jgi:hypothetical protein
MSGCVLRAFGERFDVDQFLTSSSFRTNAIFRRGERRWPDRAESRVSTTSGFNLTVSDDDGDDQGARQVADALAFIDRNRDELTQLASRDDVEVCLDFGSFFREGMEAKFVRLPHEIVQQCATLGVDIEVSVYAVASSDGTGA